METQEAQRTPWRTNPAPIEASQIGQRIKSQRLKVGMSRHNLASASGLSVTTIIHLEDGHFIPSNDSAKRLDRALGMNLFQELAVVTANRRDLVLQTIRGYVSTYYAPPTIRWLCDKTGIHSTSLMRHYIYALIGEGKLVKTNGQRLYWYAVPEMIEAIKTIEWK